MCSTFVGFDSLIFLEDLDFSAASASKSECVFLIFFPLLIVKTSNKDRDDVCLTNDVLFRPM